MLVEFDDVFHKPPIISSPLPQIVLDELSKELPVGFKYVQNSDGSCSPMPEGEQVKITDIVLDEDTEFAKALGDNYTLEDILKYSYNAQKPIPIRSKYKDAVTINGEKIPFSKLSYNPFEPMEITIEKAFAFPSPFPPPFKIEVACDKYKREIEVKRTAHDSINVNKFISTEGQPLSADYYIDTQARTLKVNFKTDLKYAKTVKDVVETLAIFNAFHEGTGIFAGEKLQIAKVEVNKYNKIALSFWEKVLTIENILDCVFSPDINSVDDEVTRDVETLYQNFVSKNPIKCPIRVESINGKWQFSSDEDIMNKAGKPSAFIFDAYTNVELFGVSVNLPCIVGIFNVAISSYSKDGDEYTLFLTDCSAEEKMHVSQIIFPNEDQQQEYRNIGDNILGKKLFDAKSVHEYMNL